MDKYINKIIHGDCLEVMKEMPDKSVDLVVTDPPYELYGGGDSDSCFGDSHRKIKKGLEDINKGFDYDLFFKETSRVLKAYNAFIFCSNRQLSKYLNFAEANKYSVTVLIWWKYNSIPFSSGTWRPDIEYIIHIKTIGSTFQGNSELKSKVDRLPINQSRYGHPTEKPIELIKKYIKVGSNENDIILDPFGGSCTTAVACKQLKRNYICIEKEEKYVNICHERLAGTTSPMF
jgi:site-specific DNA-methyltransferase (adenine-specific)